MINFKQKIAEKIAEEINIGLADIYSNIEIPKDKSQGDYAFPCFRLAKTLKKSPQIIAEELSEKLRFEDNLVEKQEVIRRIY